MTPTQRRAIAEIREQSDWYNRHRAELPAAPFRLAQGATVTHPARYYAAIEEAIAHWDGSSDRIWVCLLLLEIRKLRSYLEKR